MLRPPMSRFSHGKKRTAREPVETTAAASSSDRRESGTRNGVSEYLPFFASAFPSLFLFNVSQPLVSSLNSLSVAQYPYLIASPHAGLDGDWRVMALVS